jgi:hypothetical protein
MRMDKQHGTHIYAVPECEHEYQFKENKLVCRKCAKVYQGKVVIYDQESDKIVRAG